MASRKRPFLAGLILCEQRPGAITYLKACNPPNFNFSNELGIVIFNAFPPTKPESNIIYMFTTEKFICFDLVIVLPDILYSIILLTKLKIPNVYISFLQELSKTFSLIDKESFDPLPLFDYTFSLLRSWKWVNQSKFFAQYPDGAYYIEIDSDSYCFLSFDPLAYFQGSDVINEVWRAVITGAGLHIICDDPEVLTGAAFAAQSIISPLAFLDQILITFNPEDERFKDIDAYSIVATTPNVDLSSIRTFKYTVEAKKTTINLTSSSSNKIRDEIKGKTKRVVEINVFMMDRMLRKNPFNDLLEGPYMTDDADPLFEPKKNKKMPILLPAEYRMVETTETFRAYRRKIMYRNTFRQYFLSMKPEEALNQQSLQHLKVLEQKFKDLENIFANDIHFISVLRVHQSITKKLLGKSSSSNNESSQPASPSKKVNFPNAPNEGNIKKEADLKPDATAKPKPDVNKFDKMTNLPEKIEQIDSNTEIDFDKNPIKTFPSSPLHRVVSDPKSESNDPSDIAGNIDNSSPKLQENSTENNLYLFRMNDDDVSLSCNFLDQGNDVSYDTEDKVRTLSDPHIQPEASIS